MAFALANRTSLRNCSTARLVCDGKTSRCGRAANSKRPSSDMYTISSTSENPFLVSHTLHGRDANCVPTRDWSSLGSVFQAAGLSVISYCHGGTPVPSPWGLQGSSTPAFRTDVFEATRSGQNATEPGKSPCLTVRQAGPIVGKSVRTES